MRRGKYEESDPEEAKRLGDQCTATPNQRIFRYNPGKTLKLFPPKHPYYKVPNEAIQISEELANLEYVAKRRKEIREQVKPLVGTLLYNQMFDKPVTLSNASIKEYLNQPHKHISLKNELLLKIQDVFKTAKYLGFNTTYKKDGVLRSHIFEIDIGNESSWLVVREYSNGECRLYSVSDSERIASNLEN